MSPPTAEREEITLGELVDVARRRVPWVVAGLAAGVGAAVLWLRLVPLEYEARAQLLFQAEGAPSQLLEDLDSSAGLGLLLGSSAAVTGEIEALRARPLLEGVLRAEGPGAPEGRSVRVDDLARASAWRALFGAPPELGDLSVEVQAWPFPDDEPEGLVLEFRADGRLGARREGLFGARAEPVAWSPGAPVTVLGATLVVRASGPLEGRFLRVRCPVLARAADELAEALRLAEEPSGSSAVLLVVPDCDPRRARALANRLIEAYLAENQARRRRQAGRPLEFLEGELARVRADLGAAEGRLQAFGEERGPLALPGTAAELVRRLAEVDLQRAKLDLERQAAAELLARLRTGELSSDELAALEASGVFAHDMVVPLIGLVARRAELVREFTAEHPEVAQADAAIAQRVGALESVLTTEHWKRAEAARGFDTLVADYQDELDALPAIQVEYAREQRAVEGLTQIYLYLVARVEEAKIAQASSVPQVEVLAWAAPPYEPSSAAPWKMWVGGIVLGLAAGLGAAFLREYQERPLVSVRRVESLLGVECLAPARGRVAEGDLRTLRALLPRSSAARRAVVIVPVGRRAREGELAAAFARACARAGERVLLADAGDGKLAQRVPPASGAAEAGAYQATDEPGLARPASGPATPAELVRALPEWGRAFERVVVSAPAPARSPTAYELAWGETDCILCVAGVGEEELLRVARRLAQCGARPAAAVLER